MRKLVDFVDFKQIEENFDPRYVGSRFELFKNLQATTKGKQGEKAIVTPIMEGLGFKVEKPENSDHDRIIDGVKTEIKTGTLNKGTDKFSFLQIRPTDDYEQIYFVAVLPNEVRMFRADKEDLQPVTFVNRKGIEVSTFAFKQLPNNYLGVQHGGQDGTGGTYMFYPTLEELTNFEEIDETYAK